MRPFDDEMEDVEDPDDDSPEEQGLAHPVAARRAWLKTCTRPRYCQARAESPGEMHRTRAPSGPTIAVTGYPLRHVFS